MTTMIKKLINVKKLIGPRSDISGLLRIARYR